MLLGAASYVVLYQKSKDFLNPFGITVLVWLGVAGLASCQLSHLQTPWPALMYITVLLFPVTVFTLGMLTVRPAPKQRKKIAYSQPYLIFSRLMFLACFLCSVLEWAKQGFVLTLLSDAVDTKALVATIPVIHYGTVFLPFCAMASVLEWCNRASFEKLSKPYLVFSILWTVFHSLFIVSSRGTLLLLAMGTIYVVFSGKKVPFKTLVPLVLMVVVGFVLISKLRIHSMSLVFHVVEGYPLFSALYSYSALSFENLNRLVQKGPAFTLFTHSLGGFFELFGLGGLITRVPSEVTEFFNAPTLCYPFYEDLGVAGVVVFPALIYGAVALFYRKSQQKLGYTLLLAAMQKAIWVSFFGNYFTASRSDLLPYLVVFLCVMVMEHGEKMLAWKPLGVLYTKVFMNARIKKYCDVL